MVLRSAQRATTKLAVGVVAALPALLGTGAPAAAGSLQAGSGTGSITSLEVTSQREAGGNSIQHRRLTGTVDGTLQGTFVEHVSGVVHRNGLVTFSGTMRVTGVVGECGEGTITLGLSGRGQAGEPVTESRVRVINQAANTVDVTGTGVMYQEGRFVTYEIRYLCR